MLRKINVVLLSLAASLSHAAYSHENNLAQLQAISVDYELVPNQPQLFTNYMFWPIEANCKIVTEDASNTFNVVVLAKKGKINGLPISSGESLQITLYPNENLKINADSGAKVELTNLGQHTVKATCTA